MQTESTWKDAEQTAEHLGFSATKVRTMAKRGEIPGRPFTSGKRTYWRFKIAEVDAALAAKVPCLQITVGAAEQEKEL